MRFYAILHWEFLLCLCSKLFTWLGWSLVPTFRTPICVLNNEPNIGLPAV